jgi:RND superfamily putative drug exporter
MIVLLLAFGGLVAASIPLMTGIVAVVSSMGIIYFIGTSINLSVFVLNVVPMIGLAVSIDFALLYIHRFREELQHHEVRKAVSITNRTAGKAIAFSGTCVVLGLAGMFFINIDIFRSIAVGGIVAVFISVISALTFLPALLSIIGKNINKAMILKTKENADSKWRSFANFVMKRPVITALAAFLILIIAATPIRNIDLEIPNADSLPADSQTRIAYEKFEDSFLPSNQSNVPIVIETKDQKDLLSKESLENIESFIIELKKDGLVNQVDSIFTYTNTKSADELYQILQSEEAREKLTPVLERIVNEDSTHLTVKLDADYKTAKAKDWVREAETRDIHPELTHTIGGQAKFTQEIFDEIQEQVPKGLLLIILATYFILFIAFRSVLIPLKAILMNILSLGAAFGIIVWVFQYGNLGVDPNPIALMIPILTFAIVFGLSMDYEVFLISRIQEIYRETGDNDKATLEGLITTSKIITSAAAIMIAVTGAFAFTDIVPVKQIGVGVALAIFIDATLVRMVLVPSLMKLLGKWNWWFPGKKKTQKSIN